MTRAFNSYIQVTTPDMTSYYNAGTSSGGAITINWNNGFKQYITTSESITGMTFSNMVAGYTYSLIIIYGGTHTITFDSNVRWQNGQTPSCTSLSGYEDKFRFEKRVTGNLIRGYHAVKYATT